MCGIEPEGQLGLMLDDELEELLDDELDEEILDDELDELEEEELQANCSRLDAESCSNFTSLPTVTSPPTPTTSELTNITPSRTPARIIDRVVYYF